MPSVGHLLRTDGAGTQRPRGRRRHRGPAAALPGVRTAALQRGLEHAVRRGGAPLLLAARLIPIVPFSLMCYVAGAAGVRLWRFVWTTGVGFLPLTAAVTYLGSRAESLSTSDPLVWVAVAVMLALVASTRLIGFAGAAASDR